ncbi:Uu.00g107680.m01.CDS01 [Anthostomella pinea]|uniref:glucan endo-1,3-beta-D-glucosidase n=1 Tax=Anthostomella pinea TaxID=933095 RepID=A0AAI8YG09_9PEZI|nr:Uu.00g107680.m01.CDS01 [Anthostomella pinea]
MSRRYSFGSDAGENAPLDNPSAPAPYLSAAHSRPPPAPSSHHSSPTRNPEPELEPEPRYRDHPLSSSLTRAGAPTKPGSHPDSAFSRLRQKRRQSRSPERAAIAAGVGGEAYALADTSSSRPNPPTHRDSIERAWGHEAQPNSITPGADNFGEAASGGIPGLAMSVAERNARESGMDAMRGPQQYQQQPPYPQAYQRPQPQQTAYDDDDHAYGYDRGYGMTPGYGTSGHNPYEHSYASSPHLAPLGVGAALSHSGRGTPTRSVNSYSSDPFRDPHLAYGQRMDPNYGQFNPNDIEDDGDDGLVFRRSARNSMLSLGNRGGNGAAAAGAAGTAAAAGYDPVQNPGAGASGVGAGGYDLGARAEKPSEWISKQNNNRKKWKWLIIIIAFLIIAGGIAGGVVGGLLHHSSSDSDDGQSASDDNKQNGDLDINSSEIKALMNNPNLHKVFPGVDYTPINVQYPDCLDSPPSQNNVTRDVAVLSQLTNTIRLYGTDCNQTEMTIHALKQLKLEDEIKIWLGVWQDTNTTTNERQLSRMWTILDQYGTTPFKGLIVGNEILFRKDMNATELGNLLDSVRTNLTAHDWALPVATSDLGDNWNSELASISDYIMGNVHPFFAGVDEKEAAAWTWQFWQNQAGTFFKTESERNVISEIGWPTKGGTDCGSDTVTSCPDGSVAGIDGLNTLLETWVCQALANGTNYFWFEMFDEPWKISFDEPGKEWEDQWGIMDVNRKLKDGVTIPDCGGKTV